MAQTKIKFNEENDVREFVKAASRCDFDVDIKYERMIVDAKSILGIFSLGLTKTLIVQCHGENEEFNQTIAKFAIA